MNPAPNFLVIGMSGVAPLRRRECCWLGDTRAESELAGGVSWIAFVALAPLERKQGRCTEFLGLLSLCRRHLDGIKVGMRSWYAEFLGLLSLVRRHLSGSRAGMRSFLDCFRCVGATWMVSETVCGVSWMAFAGSAPLERNQVRRLKRNCCSGRSC